MRFGTFREVAYVEYAKETQNETGEFIQTWHCFSKIRCSITSCHTRKAPEWNRRRATRLGSVELGSFLASLERCGFDGRAATTRFSTFHRLLKSATKNITPLFVKRGRKWGEHQSRDGTSSAGAALNLTTRKYKNKSIRSFRRFWRFRLISEESTLVLPCDELAR